MKKHLFILLIIFFTASVVGQENSQDSVRIDLIEQKLDSIIEIQKNEKVRILEERITQATETISNQNSIISSFGTLYSIITIVFALIGIALPILTYQFGIRPSQNALKEFEKNAENKFNLYLKEKHKKEIDNAINNLKSEDSFTRNNSINYLSLNYHNGFNNSQINSLLDLLKDESLDENTTNQIHHCISNQKNENVKSYFINYLSDTSKTEVDTKIYYCIRFLNNYDFADYKSHLANYISNKEYAFNAIAIYLAQMSKSNLLNLFSEKEIIDKLTSNELSNLKSSYESYLKSTWKIDRQAFEDTYLYNKINTYS